MILYADVLFGVNLAMDLLSLGLTASLTRRKIGKFRLFAAASLGALSATVMTAVPGIGRGASALCGVLLSAGMAAAAFGWKDPRRLLADSVILWGARCALGGLLTLFSEIGTPVYAGGDGFPLLYLGAAAVSFLWTRVRRRAAENRTVRVRIEAAGRKEELTGLCDTGSFAADPIGGIPAILVKRKAVPILAALAESAAAGKAESGIRVRMIPVRGLGGERLLTGFVPDRTFVGDAEVRAAVAVDGEGESYGGAVALVPARLIP